MILRFTDVFRKQYKKADKRIQKSFDQQLKIFLQNPMDPQLRNHQLRIPYHGQRSINVTNDWRAVFKSVQSADDTIIYFTALGTHNQLYF